MAKQTGNRLQQPTETLQAATVTGPTKQASQSIQSLLGSNATLKAEICWTLKVITSHYSFKSSENAVSLSSCFPTAKLLNILLAGKEKQHIWQPLGLHLIFLSLLKGKVRDQSKYVLLFDESLNSEMQS